MFGQFFICQFIAPVVVAVVVLVAPPSARAEPIDLARGVVVFDGAEEFSWTNGSGGSETPESFAGASWQEVSKPPHVGSGSEYVWYKFDFVNKGPVGKKFALFSTDAFVAENVILRLVRADGGIEIARSGTAIPMESRSVKSRAHVLPFHLASGETVTAYLGIQSLYTRNLLYQIRDEASWDRYDSNQTVLFGFYFGVLVFVSLVILSVYFKTRETLALSYSVFCWAMLVATFVGLGFLNRVIPNDVAFETGSVEIGLVSLVLVAIGWFTREFLEVRKWSRPLWWYYTATSVVAFGTAAMAFSGVMVRQVAIVNDFWIQFSGVISLAAGIYAERKQKTPYALSFVFGLGAYMAGGILWNLQFTAKLPSTWLTFHGLFCAQILQDLIFAFAIIKQLTNKVMAGIEAQEAAKYGEKMGNLVRVLTHDLANYMTIIQGNAFMLSDDSTMDPSVRQVFAGKIFQALKQQREVLDSIRELKSIEDGKAELKIAPCALSDVLEHLEETFEHRLLEKKVRLTVDINESSKVIVLAEKRTLFHSVICNLVSNAIKFSEPEQGVEIKVEEGKEDVKLHVVDHGVGIPNGMIDKIFDSSEKTSRTGTSGEKGTGFGLPICKAYMVMYGGQIAVASRTSDQDPNHHGTTFTLIFKKAA